MRKCINKALLPITTVHVSHISLNLPMDSYRHNMAHIWVAGALMTGVVAIGQAMNGRPVAPHCIFKSLMNVINLKVLKLGTQHKLFWVCQFHWWQKQQSMAGCIPTLSWTTILLLTQLMLLALLDVLVVELVADSGWWRLHWQLTACVFVFTVIHQNKD